jgi:hypothetical protein
MVLRLDVGAEFIKRFVVLFLFQMGEFVGDDHPKKRFGYFFKKMGNSYLVFGFEFPPLYARNKRMGSQCRA